MRSTRHATRARGRKANATAMNTSPTALLAGTTTAVSADRVRKVEVVVVIARMARMTVTAAVRAGSGEGGRCSSLAVLEEAVMGSRRATRMWKHRSRTFRIIDHENDFERLLISNPN